MLLRRWCRRARSARRCTTSWIQRYSSVISACAKGAQLEQALQLQREMPRPSVEPKVIRFSAAVSACEKGARPEQAPELLREMQRQRVEPDVISGHP